MNFITKKIFRLIILTLFLFAVNGISVPLLYSKKLKASPQQHKLEKHQNYQKSRELQKAAEQIYRQAITLFEQGAYWNCARELFILMDFYPQFHRMDGVIYYMAECLFEEEMNAAALKMFKYLIKKYSDSKYLPAALFGLEKASFKEQNYKRALTIYYRILKRINNASVIDAARYFAGQSHYHLNNYDTAINIFKQIRNTSEYYDGALYTTALVYLKKKSVATSIDYFRKIIALPIISGERRRIVDDARLTLGYIYYELGLYKKAIILFSGISYKHENFQDALLSLGWAYLKLTNYSKAIKPLLKLIDLYPESANAEEAYFLLGQAYIKLGQYNKAIKSYKTIVELFPHKFQNISAIKIVNNSLLIEKEKIEDLKVQILIQESKLLTTLPLNGYSDDVPQYLINEKKKLEEFRENLIKRLLSERDNLMLLQTQIDNLTKLSERKERRKDWRGYAEYGISRALFLKEMENKAN